MVQRLRGGTHECLLAVAGQTRDAPPYGDNADSHAGDIVVARACPTVTNSTAECAENAENDFGCCFILASP